MDELDRALRLFLASTIFSTMVSALVFVYIFNASFFIIIAGLLIVWLYNCYTFYYALRMYQKTGRIFRQ